MKETQKKNISLGVTSDMRLSLTRLIFFCIAKYKFPQKIREFIV
jgi:hypothetical protein